MSSTSNPSENPCEPSERTPLSDGSRVWVLVYIFGLVFFQGLLVNHLTVLFPVIKKAFDLDNEAIGQIASLAFAGGMPALFLSGYVTEWIRPRLSGTVAVGAMVAGCIVIGTANSLGGVVAGIMITQFGVYWVLAVHSSVIANMFAESRQRLFFLIMAMLAVGAIFGPPLIGVTLDQIPASEWGSVYVWMGIGLLGLFALLQLVCGRRIAPLSFRSGVAERRNRPRISQDDQTIVTRIVRVIGSGVFNRPALYILGLIVILDNLATMNIISWVGIIANERFGAGSSDVGFLSSAMAAGVLVGRIFMATFVSGKISDRKLLGYSYGLAMLLFMFMLIAPSMFMLYAMYFMMSFFIAAQSATTYAIGADKLKDRAAVGIPIVDGIGSLGSLCAPLIIGYLSRPELLGLDRALWLIPFFGFLLMIVSIGWEWVETRSKA